VKFNIRSRCFVALTKPLPVRLTLLPFLLGCPSAWGFSIQSLRTFADNFHRLCMENAGDTSWVVKLAVCACPLMYRGVWPKVWGCLPMTVMTTVVECACVCFVQTSLGRFKKQRGDNHLGCVEQACFRRLPSLISNDSCYPDRWCDSSQLTSVCVFLCVCPHSRMRWSTRQRSHVAKEATRITINLPYTRKEHQWSVDVLTSCSCIRIRRCRRLTTKKGG
jgi:hypothetical protein